MCVRVCVCADVRALCAPVFENLLYFLMMICGALSLAIICNDGARGRPPRWGFCASDIAVYFGCVANSHGCTPMVGLANFADLIAVIAIENV